MRKTAALWVSLVLTIGILGSCAGGAKLKFSTGKYTAVKQGHNGPVTVEVAFDASRIESVTVTQHQETPGIGDTAMETLSRQIVAGQTLALDSISGATVSSSALLAAVEDCVIQAGGSVTALMEKKHAGSSSPGRTETVQLKTDFVIIGGGPAGLGAAISAAEAGVKVILFEKSAVTGGAANMGMGPLAIGSDIQKKQGDTMNVDEAYNMFMEYTHYRTDGVLVRRYFDLSAQTIGWLESMGVRFEEAARYFDKSYPSWHIVASDDGTKGGGQAATMTRRMTERARALGVEIYLSTAGTEVVMNNGIVTGARAEAMDGGTAYEVDCSAVLIATGGFGDNAEMVKKELGYTYGIDYFGMRVPNHDGDGILMADAAGAGRSEITIEMIFNVFRPDSQGRGPVDVTYALRQPNLLVNREGNRFFNEEQVQNTTYCGNALVQQSGNTGFMIMDETIKRDYMRNGVPFASRVYNITDFTQFDRNLEAANAQGYTAVQKAGTIRELAEKMGIDADTLERTVADYNAVCASGRDPLGKSREFLRPISTGPYYAAQYYPSSYGTLGGIRINSDLEVLTEDARVIPGLYSAGTDACTIFGDSYMFLLPGNTMGFSINSGRLAGDSAAQYIKAAL
ncbi:FAD-dependent oxidoreductase [Breznakiella homolactica]|uniref:FAD-dependent oxidoreductase n=1 Tax=Breznakiella homolactica TaxID=2798577 RepID=A0A7T7XP60_9SPIR|nr:FAD-dependent oxidoreductase [Breznakiella homolactica]QQO09916.1 FAD-dependent oxidoreductase [Breznakiella homolactica]